MTASILPFGLLFGIVKLSTLEVIKKLQTQITFGTTPANYVLKYFSRVSRKRANRGSSHALAIYGKSKGWFGIEGYTRLGTHWLNSDQAEDNFSYLCKAFLCKKPRWTLVILAGSNRGLHFHLYWVLGLEELTILRAVCAPAVSLSGAYGVVANAGYAELSDMPIQSCDFFCISAAARSRSHVAFAEALKAGLEQQDRQLQAIKQKARPVGHCDASQGRLRAESRRA